MARLLTLVLSGPASLALIACNQGPAAEANREAEAIEAMTNDLRSDAEQASKRADDEDAVKSGLVDGHSKTDGDASAAKANPATN
ncbi:hypothetical protein [Porphyrobacter sp. AAP60]|uniref:hypothetical protein n=1 Tax=Porphyrobacter sp. AAP60 TaxID=1523423 RepID=UPI0006BA0781|nr:hypothetical protein [Porphyrobacter sp. AAP60]KPF65071.1 hypothetical protein IP79_02415 [Porphyrobacter sp. AAP60]